MAVLVACKNDEDPLKMKALESSQHFSHYKSMEFYRRSRVANSADPGPTLTNFEPTQAFTQDFLHFNPMGAICCHGNQSSHSIWPKT